MVGGGAGRFNCTAWPEMADYKKPTLKFSELNNGKTNFIVFHARAFLKRNLIHTVTFKGARQMVFRGILFVVLT